MKPRTSETDILVDEIIAWIAENAGNQAEQIGPNSLLLETQLLDSLQLMDLVFHLEEKFELQIPLDYLTPEHFETPMAVGAMVGSIEK